MYGWLYNTFGTTQFTIDDFRMIFPSPQPTKTVHDLIRLDFMKRVRRGRYQMVKPEEYVKQIIRDNLQKEEILKDATKPYAYCDSTAVNIWTDGYYWTDFTKGFKPIHIRVYSKDLKYWIDFFKNHDAEYVVEGEHKTLFGVTYVLHPTDAFVFEKKDDDPVVTLKETIKFCDKNRLVYGPALEFLKRRYNPSSYDEKVAV